jgi:hypothetical protein
MPIVFHCPACDAELTLSDAAAGRRGKCPHCKGDIIVPSGDGPAAPSPPPPGQAFTPDPPVAPAAAQAPPASLPTGGQHGYARSDYENPYGGRQEPHRGSTIQVMGILSFFFVPWVLGPLAWIWGNQDLKKMNAGVMDNSGRSATEAGKICGMISTILHGVILVLVMLMVIMPIFCCMGIGLMAPKPPGPGTSFSSTFPDINKEIDAELAAESFLDELKDGEYAAANLRTSRNFQSRQGEAGLRALVGKYPILSNFKSRDTDTKKKTSLKATLEASFEDQNGVNIKGTIEMVKEAGSWKVDQLTIP